MSHSHQPTLTSAAALRADLSTPGTKLCLREYFDGDRAHHILQAPPEVLSADHRAKLNRVLRHAKVSADSRWYLETRYDFSTTRNPAGKAQGQGRVYGDVTLGTLPTDIRNYIATGCTDLDIGNSHPTCLLHACKQAGIEAHAPCLAEYVQHCGAVLAEIKADYGLIC